MHSKPAPLRLELDELIRKARKHVMTPEELFEQRVSFVYGNVAMSNPNVTKEMVRQIALAELPDKSKLTTVKSSNFRTLYGNKTDFPVVVRVSEPQMRKGEDDDEWMEMYGW